MRTLVFSFDGTRNGRDDDHATNVLRFHNALSPVAQGSFYFAGPGNEDEGGYLHRLLGGAVGLGSRAICDDAFKTLAAAYRAGDRLAVVGFSRGAAIARMFAAQIARDGVNDFKPDICFLGCFDTVGAFLPFGKAQQETLFHDLHVAANVQHAFHAVALDEDRKAFAPNLMNQREGITEKWFAGCHADIGGGYARRGLAEITLEWMTGKAASCGLVFDDLVCRPDPAGHLHRETGMLRRGPRRLGVMRDNTWTDETATLHTSVDDRRYDVPDYRPMARK